MKLRLTVLVLCAIIVGCSRTPPPEQPLQPKQTATPSSLPQAAQATLDRLNAKCTDNAWLNQITRLEQPTTSIEANGISSGEVSAFVADCKRNLATQGVQIRWNTMKKQYEAEKTQQ